MRNIDRKRLIQRYYLARAGDYDAQKKRTWKASGGFGDEVVCAMLSGLSGLKDALVLEAGVGSGRNAFPVLKNLRPRFIGVDLSKEMLQQTKKKLSTFKKQYDLVLGDAENLPFVNGIFDVVVCMSTMHYFNKQDVALRRFSQTLKSEGRFIYGDLTVHESDDEGFLEKLERTVSKAHVAYRKPSEMKRILKYCGFHTSRIETFAYRKSLHSLMEDKGRYFNVPAEALMRCVRSASTNARALYNLTDTELTLYYTVITANKQRTDTMSQRSTCLKTPKQQGQKTLALVTKLGIINKDLEIGKDDKSVYVPLVGRPSRDVIKSLKESVPECRFSTHVFAEKKQEASLADLLAGKLPGNLLASLPHSADIVGDIAITEIPSELDKYRQAIGEAILKANKNVHTVLAKAGAVSGTYRLRNYAVIAGESKTETIHKEYGCRYYVNVAKAYFSPRLSNEHNRVAALAKDGETVVDLFAGVGPFAVRIAKTHEDVKVYAIDINPDAVEYLEKNIRLNRVEGKVHALLGDARQLVSEKFAGIADRVIMNLPEKAGEFVDVACVALKPAGGTVHFYGFINASESIEGLKARFIEAVEGCGRRVDEVFSSRFVRATAPYEWQAVLDAYVK